MTWLSHSTIATAIVLPFQPHLIPVAVLGSTAPDWLEPLLKPFMPYLEHRRETHYLLYWLLFLGFTFLIDFNNILFWFAVGGISHILADSLTVSGVPFAPFSHNRFHLFGGAVRESDFYKFRTGDFTEYIIAVTLLVLSLLISKPIVGILNENEFNEFFIDYKSLYENGIIDEKELKENRFNFF